MLPEASMTQGATSSPNRIEVKPSKSWASKSIPVGTSPHPTRPSENTPRASPLHQRRCSFIEFRTFLNDLAISGLGPPCADSWTRPEKFVRRDTSTRASELLRSLVASVEVHGRKCWPDRAMTEEWPGGR